MTAANTPMPGADLQPIEDPRAAPEQGPLLVPGDDKPEIADTGVQPT